MLFGSFWLKKRTFSIQTTSHIDDLNNCLFVTFEDPRQGRMQ
jgi:hypothetical protein